MSGFALGLTTGVLAGAAVYYTLSTGLEQSTAHLRNRLAYSTAVLEHSFSPVEAPAPVSLVGPSAPVNPPLNELVRRRWNTLVAGAVEGARETDWAALGRAAWDSGRELGRKLGETATPAAEDAARAVAATGEAAAADAVVAVASATAAAEEAAKKKTTVNVDAPLRPTPKITETPKRLV